MYLCTRKFLLTVLFCLPACIAFGETTSVSEPKYKLDELSKSISEKTTIKSAGDSYLKAAETIINDNYFANVPKKEKRELLQDVKDEIKNALNITNDGSTPPSGSGATNGAQDQSVETGDTRTEEEKAQELQEKQQAYEDAKEKEQSKENRLLTAATTAATGIGGMQLAQGLAEQKADKDAEQDMAAYTATMRCKYGDKSVKAGIEEIELPGGNDETMMKLRTEYFALAADLKERKEALGIKPGIESEVILDKAQMGLYDDENVGITDGAYASLYRANMLNSEKDQQQIDEAEKTSKNRVIGGATAAGVGVVGGIVGDSLINGKLGEKLKQAINDKKIGKETQQLLKKEADALKNLQSCLKHGGVRNTEELNFENFFPSVLTVSSSDKCTPVNPNTPVKDLFTDDTDATNIFNKLVNSFGSQTTLKMIGVPQKTSNDAAIAIVSRKIATVQQKFKDAVDKDKETAKQQGFNLENISNISNGNGLRALTSLFNNTNSDEPFSLSTFLNKK